MKPVLTDRDNKENILCQHGKVIWFTGLPGSGKTTLARNLCRKLIEMGFLCQHLDGDQVRKGISADLGFSLQDREENIRRIAEICKILTNIGIITLCSFVSPTEKIRNKAKEVIGRENFIEIYVCTPLEICEKRDVSGFFKKSRAGEIKDFTGVSSPYEVPFHPLLEIDTSEITVENSIEKIVTVILPHIQK
jgi:adenylylsulfate kinase